MRNELGTLTSVTLEGISPKSLPMFNYKQTKKMLTHKKFGLLL